MHLCCRYGQVAILAFLALGDDALPSVQRGLVDLPDGEGDDALDGLLRVVLVESESA